MQYLILVLWDVTWLFKIYFKLCSIAELPTPISIHVRHIDLKVYIATPYPTQTKLVKTGYFLIRKSENLLFLELFIEQ